MRLTILIGKFCENFPFHGEILFEHPKIKTSFFHSQKCGIQPTISLFNKPYFTLFTKRFSPFINKWSLKMQSMQVYK